MKHLWRLVGAMTLVLLAFALPAAATTAANGAKDEQAYAKGKGDDFRSPQQKRYDAALQQGLQAKLEGKASGKVHRTANGQYVQLERTGTDNIFVILVEFGNERSTATSAGIPIFLDTKPDGTPASNAQRFDGPLHNQIPQPNRAIDNSTLWQADFNQGHYDNMYFNRMAKYYETQSSGRYSVKGDVTEWVKVPFNEALYGRNYCGSIVCNTSKALVRDALAAWTKKQLDAGMTMAQIQTYLRTFDQQDRYDSNGNGNFNEPDGFIDHFQIVHAGGDEAASDPIYGTDAIWSHRSYANLQGGGPEGFPGVNIGSNGGLVSSTLVPNNPTGVWVGDYTMQPENGGLGVFAHEFGHDLGLPDLYDTSGNTGGAENNTTFWSLMSSGANIGDGGPNGIGDAPTDLGAWEKFQLGWLGGADSQGVFYEVARAGQRSEHKLGPNDSASKQAQALFVLLPTKSKNNVITAPKAGSYAYWSGAGDNFSHTLTKSFTIPAGGTIAADVWYDTEAHFDYFFVEVSSNGGTTWLPVTTNLSLPASDDDGSFNGSGTGTAGSSGGAYKSLVSTSALPTGNVLVRFRYETDANTGGKGVVFDNVAVTGSALDGGEDDAVATAWTYDGFLRIKDGIGVTQHFNAYVAENRQYDGYDKSLATAYNFGFLSTLLEDKVESYPFQNGLLVTYWDESESNNNVGDHPGSGLILPVDAHPTWYHSYDGHLLRPRILAYDSTFGLEPTDSITLNKEGHPVTIPSAPAVSTFNDLNSYWSNTDEHAATGAHDGRYQPGWYSVNVPKTGTTIRVKSVSAQGSLMQVEVAPAK
jgi:immune inhibitor A